MKYEMGEKYSTATSIQQPRGTACEQLWSQTAQGSRFKSNFSASSDAAASPVADLLLTHLLKVS